MGQRKALTAEEEKIIIDAYTKEKRGQIYCGNLVGVGVRVVKAVLKKHGIHIRNFSEAATESNQNRKHEVNDEYFNRESHNMAYIMGFLAADGHIHQKDNRIEIGLSSVDTEFLETIRKELGIENEVKISQTSNGYEQCRLSFSSSKIKQSLANYGIGYDKTYNLALPKNLSKEYMIDFIRGYFDGDGSVSTAGNSAIRWQVCSATKGILEEIVIFLKEEYDIPTVSVLETTRKNPLYYIQYSTVSTRKIFDILYTPESLFLPRKYEKFKNII